MESFVWSHLYGSKVLWRDDHKLGSPAARWHWYWWKERECLDELGLRCGTKGPLPNGEPGQQAWQSWFFMIFAPFLMWKLWWCFTLEIVSMQFSALEGTDLEYENVTQISVNGTALETSMFVTSDNAGVAFGKSSIFNGTWENPPNFSIFEGDHLGKTTLFRKRLLLDEKVASQRKRQLPGATLKEMNHAALRAVGMGTWRRVVGKGMGKSSWRCLKPILKQSIKGFGWFGWFGFLSGRVFQNGQFLHGQSFFEGNETQMPGFLGCSYKKPLRCGATVEHCQKLRDLTVKPFSKSSQAQISQIPSKKHTVSPQKNLYPHDFAGYSGYDFSDNFLSNHSNKTNPKSHPKSLLVPGSCAGCVDFRPAAKAPEPCSWKLICCQCGMVNWVMGCVYLYMFFFFSRFL